MIPSLDHRKVYWWGEKSNLSIMDLDTLKISDYPVATSNSASKLITYDVLVINQKVVYVMEEAGVKGMVYLYDLLNKTLTANWTYANDDRNKNYAGIDSFSGGVWSHRQSGKRKRKSKHCGFRRMCERGRSFVGEAFHFYPQIRQKWQFPSSGHNYI